MRAGERNYKGHAIPSTAIVKTNKEGREVYISGIDQTHITFKIIGGGYYTKPYLKRIIDMFKS